MTGKWIRCCIVGLSCSVMPFAGCAQAPQSSRSGLFSWFRSRPLTEREQQNQERKQVSKELQDPAHLQLKYAQWRESVGDLADARQSYQFALKENPKSMEAKLGLARLDQLAGRTDEAEQGFQNALKSRSGDPQATNALGQFYASQKQWSKALPLLEEAANAAPSELSYRYQLAVAIAQSGDMNGAFPHFQEALGEAEAHYNIGYLLYEQGHKDMAKKRFEKALALNPRLMQAQMLLEEMELKTNPASYAEAPVPSWPTKPAIQQVSATQPVAYRTSVNTPANPEPRTLPGIKPTGTHPQPLPSYPPVSEPTAPVEPTKPTQTFRATRPKEWSATQTAHQPKEYLPPYQPPTQSPGANASQAATTPPITPAQREQWENQMKGKP